MNLRDVMKDYLNEPVKNPSLGLIKESFITPCNVKPKKSWQEDDSEYSKNFNFSSREPMRSFCSYLLDLEEQTGVKICLQFNSSDNSVLIKLPKSFLNMLDFSKMSSKVDNIHFDVKESYKNERSY